MATETTFESRTNHSSPDGTGPAGEIAPARANRAPGGAGLIEDYLGLGPPRTR